ncbi:LytR/AlgR family response regulator transcription factor [Romboutsia lituseburensis]|uniref:LytR/AlgR family response regulator transcription factor n=1 Tax=Romboutsia lituseburensis TaxID=1537 RepID=UPI00215B0D17|nr:LytTR family DNA-binding domain-containing protein [Romboutsia lituseburensis]MCR8746682.1 LytTR family DNA-binding domain-containing protein [Romboutsia lituseburensis]
MINVSICCNDLKQTNILNDFFKNFSSSNHLKYKLSKYSSFDHLVCAPPENLDILFLSINLNNKQSVHDINNKFKLLYKNLQIIFIPEIMDFMLNGFCLKDFRYILMPLKYESFEDEVSSCLNDLKKPKSATGKSINNIFQFKNYEDIDKPLVVLSGISTNSILFIESRGDHCLIYTPSKCVKKEYRIDQLEKKLCPSTFFRCHDSFIINIKKINKLTRSSVIVNSKIIPVSEKSFKTLKDKLLVMLKII